MRFQNKTAIVTGAYRGIGYACARQLAAEGANLVLTDVVSDGLSAAADEIRGVSGGEVSSLAGDIGDRDFVRELISLAVRDFGRIDCMVNNAGISLKESLLTGSADWWDTTLRVNLSAMFHTCRLAARQMVIQDQGGAIVNVSSIGGTRAKGNSAAYDASKGGVEAFTRSAAVELAPWAIRVNAIAPASILGHYVPEKPPEWTQKRMVEKFDTPLLRQGTPEDCAKLICFLLSGDASFITGQCIAIDGGLSIQARPAGAGMRITPQNVSEFITDEWKL